MQEIKCRIAPSLGGGFAGTPNEVWGTETYNPEIDQDKPCVFFGLYGLPDFYALWRHKGKKWILWAGSDITNFVNGYWLEDGGNIRIDPKPLAEWVNKNCESWVENIVEQKALSNMGISAQICPSFLGNVNNYEITYRWSDKPKVYTSVSGDDFKLYGWDKIDELAANNPDVGFHLYGNKGEWKSSQKNVIIHGRVSQEQMNSEIIDMQGALRLTQFDGASELIVKAMLWGQYAFSYIPYPYVSDVSEIGSLKDKKEPNGGSGYYKQTLNKFPWNIK